MALPAELAALVAHCVGQGLGICDDANDLPGDPGAYLLGLRLGAAVELSIQRFTECILPPGWYLYAGSARGPGGIAARAGRHMRKSKPLRWHIDHLTVAAEEVFALPVLRGDECGLIAALLQQPEFTAPVTGFGSSDCRQCPAHLVVFKPPTTLNRHSRENGNPEAVSPPKQRF